MDGRGLKVMRLSVGWSQEELGRAARLCSTTVSRMERTGAGHPESWQRVETALARRVRQVEQAVGASLGTKG